MNDKMKHLGNWGSAVLWAWLLLACWSCLSFPDFFISNTALSVFLILVIQILLFSDIKKMILLRDKEWNYVCIILMVTIICLFLADSKPGAFFTICNLVLLLYMSDRWEWEFGPQCIMMCACVLAYLQWLFWPFLTTEQRNPNMAGTVIAFLTFVLLTFLERWVQNEMARNVLEIALLIVSAGQLLLYHGRGMALALLFFTVMKYFVPSAWWEKEKLYKLAFGILTVGSVIFTILYVAAWKVIDPDRVIRIFGKRLFSGRESIWLEFLERFIKHPLWGTGTNFTIKSWVDFNVHNAMLDIFVIHGVIVFALVVAYIWWKMEKLYRIHPRNHLFITAIAGVMAVFWESVTDMDLLWTPELMIWSLMLMVLNSDPDKIQEKIE